MELTDIAGVGEVTAKKLEDAGITTVMQLMTKSTRDVSDLTGMDSEATADLFNKARTLLHKEDKVFNLIRNATDIKKTRKDAKKFTTGCEALNKLLLGGIETDAGTEIYGEFGAGKSQIAHTCMVSVQLPVEKGGLREDKPVRVAVIDTEHTFRPERIESIAKRFELDPDEVIGNIYVAQVKNTFEQQTALEEFEKMIETENIKLLVVDSTIGLFRSEFIGRGNLSDRQGKINKFVTLAGHIAETYHIAVIFTNQVSTDPGQLFGDPTDAIGGNVMAHASTYRIYLKKSGKFRVAVMKDSPHHPDGECMYGVVEGGVVDKSVKEAEIKAAEKEAKSVKKKE